MAQSQWPTLSQLEKEYHKYKVEEINSRKFTISDIEPLLKRAGRESNMTIDILGRSVENRPIYKMSYGHGPIKILYWSQMHGDESTATMALLDFFRWLSPQNSEHSDILEEISKKYTLYFVPMLNPDGAERFQRRNALNIDLNRDAIRTTSPEAKLLKNLRDSLQPQFGFNLHDQSIYYRAGLDGDQVALGFLAPAYNHSKDINGVRFTAMQVIASLYDSLQYELPRQIAKYDDTFEPRAFGDNFQKWGTSTILIESGGSKNDPQKQYLRKINFFTFIKSLEIIHRDLYLTKSIVDYEKIPFNQHKMLDLIIENLKYQYRGKTYEINIGYSKGNKNNAYINDIGDLSVYSGFDSFDASPYMAHVPKVSPHIHINRSDFAKSDWASAVQDGTLHFIVQQGGPKLPDYFPIQFYTDIKSSSSDKKFKPYNIGENPTIVLSKNNRPEYVVSNGKIYSIESIIKEMKSILTK
ncbi:hypothetical protein GCM10025777_24560 [Membranihabitans marinus]